MIDKFHAMIEKELQTAYEKLFARVGRFDKSFMAGGCIASLALGETVSDYDIWFETQYAWEKAAERVRRAALDKSLVLDAQVGKVQRYAHPVSILAETEHAITFRIAGVEPVYQIVKSRTGDFESVCEQFDFLHAHAAYHPGEVDEKGELYFVGRNCIEFIREKILVFEGQLDYPIHTLSRLQKFALRGYKVPDQTLAVLVQAVRSAPQDLVDRDLAACGKKYQGGRGYSLRYHGKEYQEAVKKPPMPAGGFCDDDFDLDQ